MSVRQNLENLGVEVAFAEAGVAPPADLRLGSGPRAQRPLDGSRRRARNRAFLFGGMSLALYAALFLFSKPLMAAFTKGHFYALLPVATAFLFSYVHGTFTGSFWTAMGIDASSKAVRKTAQPTVAAPRRDRRPRATAQL